MFNYNAIPYDIYYAMLLYYRYYAQSYLFLFQLKVVVFDKTGTLTYGKPEVVNVLLLVKEAVCSSRLFSAVLGLAESRSEHPLGEAITRFATRVSVLILSN